MSVCPQSPELLGWHCNQLYFSTKSLIFMRRKKLTIIGLFFSKVDALPNSTSHSNFCSLCVFFANQIAGLVNYLCSFVRTMKTTSVMIMATQDTITIFFLVDKDRVTILSAIFCERCLVLSMWFGCQQYIRERSSITSAGLEGV